MPSVFTFIHDLWGKFSDCIPSKNSIIFKCLKVKKVKFFLSNQNHCLTEH